MSDHITRNEPKVWIVPVHDQPTSTRKSSADLRSDSPAAPYHDPTITSSPVIKKDTGWPNTSYRGHSSSEYPQRIRSGENQAPTRAALASGDDLPATARKVISSW